MREGGDGSAFASASASASASARSNTDGQQNVLPGVQFLRNVGEAVAAALNGFGIDVDIDVEHEGIREKVAEPVKPAGQTPTETPKQTPEPESLIADIVPKSTEAIDNTTAGIQKLDINESVYPKLDAVDASPAEVSLWNEIVNIFCKVKHIFSCSKLIRTDGLCWKNLTTQTKLRR